MYCGCKARAIDIGGWKDGEGLLEIFPLLNRVVMVDSVPLQCWLERERCCHRGETGHWLGFQYNPRFLSKN